MYVAEGFSMMAKARQAAAEIPTPIVLAIARMSEEPEESPRLSRGEGIREGMKCCSGSDKDRRIRNIK